MSTFPVLVFSLRWMKHRWTHKPWSGSPEVDPGDGMMGVNMNSHHSKSCAQPKGCFCFVFSPNHLSTYLWVTSRNLCWEVWIKTGFPALHRSSSQLHQHKGLQTKAASTQPTVAQPTVRPSTLGRRPEALLLRACPAPQADLPITSSPVLVCPPGRPHRSPGGLLLAPLSRIRLFHAVPERSPEVPRLEYSGRPPGRLPPHDLPSSSHPARCSSWQAWGDVLNPALVGGVLSQSGPVSSSRVRLPWPETLSSGCDKQNVVLCIALSKGKKENILI